MFWPQFIFGCMQMTLVPFNVKPYQPWPYFSIDNTTRAWTAIKNKFTLSTFTQTSDKLHYQMVNCIIVYVWIRFSLMKVAKSLEILASRLSFWIIIWKFSFYGVLRKRKTSGCFHSKKVLNEKKQKNYNSLSIYCKSHDRNEK